MTYQGSNLTGAMGEIVQTFSDFREVDGLTLPFASSSTFDGETMVTSTTESLLVNPELTADTFIRPEPRTAQKEGE